jgi:dipeptidyl aminopeptidase/acylaminoacyl peptidase
MNAHFAVKSERGIPKSKQFVDDTAPKFYAAGASCPFLVLAAEKDSPSTKKQNREFYQLLMDGGLKALEYIEIPGQDHMSTVQTIDDPANETGKCIRSFINRLCR